MVGPNETMVIGAMKDWQCWDRLPNITVKTLFMGAMNDTMDPSALEKASKLIPNGLGSVWIGNGSHESFYDDQIPYFTRLLQFILE